MAPRDPRDPLAALDLLGPDPRFAEVERVLTAAGAHTAAAQALPPGDPRREVHAAEADCLVAHARALLAVVLGEERAA